MGCPGKVDPPQHRVGDPHHHAVEAQVTDDEDGLVKQPHQKEPGDEEAHGERRPEPSREFRALEQGYRDRNDHREAGDSGELVGGIEENPRLPTLHHAAAGKERVDVTAGLSAL